MSESIDLLGSTQLPGLKDALLRGEQNEPLLKVLSIKEKKFFKIYVFWALGHSGQF